MRWNSKGIEKGNSPFEGMHLKIGKHSQIQASRSRTESFGFPSSIKYCCKLRRVTLIVLFSVSVLSFITLNDSTQSSKSLFSIMNLRYENARNFSRTENRFSKASTQYSHLVTRLNPRHLKFKKKNSLTLNGDEAECDIWSGKWVYDSSYPIISNQSCNTLVHRFNCETTGKFDTSYSHYRWEPENCKIPRFNTVEFLERMRGKKIVFVGDSLGRNHYAALVCMLEKVVPLHTVTADYVGRLERRLIKFADHVTVQFSTHNLTILYVQSLFLLAKTESNEPTTKNSLVLKLKQVDPAFQEVVKDSDLVIFNTGHWFRNKIMENAFMESNGVLYKMNKTFALHMAIQTVLSWADKLDPKKTKVVYRGFSPSHFDNNCNNSKPFSTLPFTKNSLKLRSFTKSVVSKMRHNPALFLDTEYLTHFRPDGHPSVMDPNPYGASYPVDCAHWCVPGVPDIWTELMYYSLLRLKGHWTL